MLRKLGQNSADIKKYFSKKTGFDVSHKLTPKAISFDFNLYRFLANSAEDKLVIFFFLFFFPRTQNLTFHEQIYTGENLHEMSNSVFWEKKEKYFNMSSAENFIQSAKLQSVPLV